MRLKIVVLPAPLGPIRPTSSPSPRVRSTASTAVSPPKRTVAFSSWSSGAAMALRAGSDAAFAQPEIEQTLRADDHEHDEQKRINHHAIFGQGAQLADAGEIRGRAQALGQEGKQNGGENHAEGVAHAADDDHDDNFDAAVEIEAGGSEGEAVMTIQPAGDAGEKCADDEGGDLVASGIEADGFAGDFVVMGGEKTAAVGGVDQAGDGEDGEGGGSVGPGEVGVGRQPDKTESAADGLDILKDDTDDFTKAEGDKREVVASEPQRGCADEQPGESGAEAAQKEGDEEERVLFERGPTGIPEQPWSEEDGDAAGEIGADGHKTGVSERELPGVAVNEVEGDGKD